MRKKKYFLDSLYSYQQANVVIHYYTIHLQNSCIGSRSTLLCGIDGKKFYKCGILACIYQTRSYNSGLVDEPGILDVKSVSQTETAIVISADVENNPSELQVNLLPEDAPQLDLDLSPISDSFVQIVLINLIPGTLYSVQVRALSTIGKYSDPFEMHAYTRLAKPRIQLTEITPNTLKGFVSISGRYENLKVSIDPEPLKFLPSFAVFDDSEFNFEFQSLVSGDRYKIVAVAVSGNGENITEFVEATLPCSPVFAKRQIILDNGWVLMALRVDATGDQFRYDVISNFGQYKDEMMARQEIVLRFPPELIGKMLNSSVTGFLSCDWTIAPIAIGRVDNVAIMPQGSVFFCHRYA